MSTTGRAWTQRRVIILRCFEVLSKGCLPSYSALLMHVQIPQDWRICKVSICTPIPFPWEVHSRRWDDWSMNTSGREGHVSSQKRGWKLRWSFVVWFSEMLSASGQRHLQGTGYKDELTPAKQFSMGCTQKMGQEESKKTFRNAEGEVNKYLQHKQPGPFSQLPQWHFALPSSAVLWSSVRSEMPPVCLEPSAEQLHLLPLLLLLVPWPAYCLALPPPLPLQPPWSPLSSSITFAIRPHSWSDFHLLYFPLPRQEDSQLFFCPPHCLLSCYSDFPLSFVPNPWHVFWHTSVHV